MKKMIGMLVATCGLSLGYAQDIEENIIIHSIWTTPEATTIDFNIKGKSIESKNLIEGDKKFLNAFINGYKGLRGNKENMPGDLAFKNVRGKSFFGGKLLNIAFQETPNIIVDTPIYCASSLFYLEKGAIFTNPLF
ncbi:hypothetical protein [Candidatus Odyssella acanthamoebae]|uniref:Uncharacterized protein n=1 Tax=Candidatus Odyssella acanthamoebae TaxID=91604 RepID=A0A077B2T4_9PROT|nr:hypothetical protein [Candidatus Paracaedibacter acanthamoebae]AIK97300.1 hypothetical protein ID47_11985 [Candidatus Paracaedibacter acanthamoebae]